MLKLLVRRIRVGGKLTAVEISFTVMRKRDTLTTEPCETSFSKGYGVGQAVGNTERLVMKFVIRDGMFPRKPHGIFRLYYKPFSSTKDIAKSFMKLECSLVLELDFQKPHWER